VEEKSLELVVAVKCFIWISMQSIVIQ